MNKKDETIKMKFLTILMFLILLGFVGLAIYEFFYLEYTMHVGFGWTNESLLNWSKTNMIGKFV